MKQLVTIALSNFSQGTYVYSSPMLNANKIPTSACGGVFAVFGGLSVKCFFSMQGYKNHNFFCEQQEPKTPNANNLHYNDDHNGRLLAIF